MEQDFTSEFFTANRSRLRDLFTGTAPIVLTANGLIQQAGDEAYPFHQDASFWYFTGCNDPDVIFVLDKDKEYFIIPQRSAVQITFDGALNIPNLKRLAGVDTVMDEQEGWRRLGARLGKVKHAATLPSHPSYIEQLGMYANPARRRLIDRMKSYNEQLELLDISQHVGRLRMVKQPVELAAMQHAIDITCLSLRDALRPARRQRYRFEYEVEAEIARGFRRRGADGHAFAPIVAGGERACTIHNVRNSSPLVADELLLCDVGAAYSHYAADITRTISLGAPTRRQMSVLETVRDVHDYALSILKPGVIMSEYEQQVEQFMGEKLRELGLVKSIDHESVRRYYPYLTSHFLGIAVHDAGVYDRPLEPNVVLTVEPGINITEEGIGVRLEDDVLITSDGNRVLSAALPLML